MFHIFHYAGLTIAQLLLQLGHWSVVQVLEDVHEYVHERVPVENPSPIIAVGHGSPCCEEYDEHHYEKGIK